ncbi:MAG: hypothetical protein ABUL42_01740 [Terricaulis silvestris]
MAALPELLFAFVIIASCSVAHAAKPLSGVAKKILAAPSFSPSRRLASPRLLMRYLLPRSRRARAYPQSVVRRSAGQFGLIGLKLRAL